MFGLTVRLAWVLLAVAALSQPSGAAPWGEEEAGEEAGQPGPGGGVEQDLRYLAQLVGFTASDRFPF